MAIEFYLNPNPVHPEKGAHKAQLLVTRTLNAKELLDAMVSRGTGVTRTDMLANEELRDSVLLMKLVQGYTIHTRLFRMRLKIEGVFTGATDSFDPKRHQVKVMITPSRFLQEQVKLIYPKRKALKRNLPHISDVHKLGKQAAENLIPGEYYVLHGSNLFIRVEDPEQGIYLKNEKKEKFRVTEYPETRPGQILFRIPADLPPGVYALSFNGCTKRGKPQSTVSLMRKLVLDS